MNKLHQQIDSGPSPAHFGRQRGGGLKPAEPYTSYAPELQLKKIPEGFELLLPFLRRMNTLQLKKIPEGFELLIAGSADKIRQLIEGKLEGGHDVHNVQVVVNEATPVNVTLHLLIRRVCFWKLIIIN